MKKTIFFFALFLFAHVINAQTYKAGDAVSIEWKGKWFPGKILEVQKDGYKISYDGYGSEWYETVTSARLKPASATTNTQTTNAEHSATQINNNNEELNNQTTNVSTVSEASYKGVETIWDIDLGSDGKTLACANAYGKLTLLNANDLTLIADIKTGSSPVNTASINASCDMIAAADGDGKIYFFTKNSGGTWELKSTLTNYSGVSRLRFIPKTNDLLVAGSPKEDYRKVSVDVFDPVSAKVKLTLLKSDFGQYSISRMSFTNDGSKVAFGISNAKKGIEVYDVTTGKLVYRIPHKYDVVGLAFSPDGKTIAAGGTDKVVTLWDVATKKAKWTSPWNDDYVYDIAFAPDGSSVAACGSGTGKKMKVYDAFSGKLKAELGEKNPGGNVICFSANSKIVYTGLTTYGDIAKVSIVYMASIPE